MPKRRSWSWWVGIACGLLIGAIVGFLIGKFGADGMRLTPKTEWDIPDILTILVTLVIALYVQHYVVEGSEIEKARRGYLIEMAEAVRDAIGRLHRDVRAETADAVGVATDISTLHAAMAELRDGLAMCKSKSETSGVEDAVRRYRAMLANIDIPVYSNVTVTEVADLEAAYADIRRLLNRLILELHSG